MCLSFALVLFDMSADTEQTPLLAQRTAPSSTDTPSSTPPTRASALRTWLAARLRGHVLHLAVCGLDLSAVFTLIIAITTQRCIITSVPVYIYLFMY